MSDNWPGVVSHVFRLDRVIEFDLVLGEDSSSIRIEILQCVNEADHFRARLWETEFFRIQPTFPQVHGRPAHEPCDEVLLLERDPFYLSRTYLNFRATSADEALRLVLAAVKQRLLHMTAGTCRGIGRLDWAEA